jgi:hypothetical protein
MPIPLNVNSWLLGVFVPWWFDSFEQLKLPAC